MNPTDTSADSDEITVTQGDIDRMVQTYQQNWSAAPDSATMEKLIAYYVRSEIFYKEALRMHLEHNDEIIRRRLNQKYEFLVKDMVDLIPPNEKELNDFYEKNSQKYADDPSISFSHIYFNPDVEKNGGKVAADLFEKLKNSNTFSKNQLGQDFYLGTTFSKKSKYFISQNFGKDFAETLFAQQKTGWQAPLQSGFGTHLVFVDSLDAATPLPYESVAEKVAFDYKAMQLDSFNTQLYENLKSKYTIVKQYQQ